MAPEDAITPGRKRDYSTFEASSSWTEDSHKIHKLEARLDAITKVGEWRLEQLKLLDAQKRAAEKILDEERKLFTELGQDQNRQHTAQIQALQENWSSLMNSRNINGNVGGFQGGFQAATFVASTSAGKLEKSLQGMREQLRLRTDERDKWKTKCKKLEEELFDAQQQVKMLTAELERCKAESVKLANALSEGNNLEEVCRDLLEQVEQRNIDLQRCKADCSEGQLAGLKQQICERDEEIQALRRIMDDRLGTKTEVTECIICMDEFGTEPDRQRAHWKDCNHANVCYKCTHTLWRSKKRKCPSCNTPASCMPGRLPPNIYL